MVKTGDWETVNKGNAIWARAKKDITQEQYDEFYKQISHDFEAPLAHTHNRVEGSTEYTQLLYLPAKAPMDLFNREKSAGVKLYVKRVFIMDDAEALLPTYLRFVKGVVDSADLPLNVSRELLQESRDVKAIREGCTKRVLGMLEDLAKHDKLPENTADGVTDVVSEEDKANVGKYTKFYAEFGAVLKEGLGEDFGNKERLAKLLRFASSTTDTVSVGLADYKARMKEGQEAIYYITADTLAAAKNSPQLEVFKKKGIEVLLMTDRVDEWALNYLHDFDGTPLQSVAKGAVDLGKLQDEAEKKAAEEAAEVFQTAAGQAQGSAQRQGRRRARDHPFGGQPRLPGGARPRHEHTAGAHAQASRSDGTGREARTGSQRRTRAGQKARWLGSLQRSGAHPV
jgi:molecular chaperone HtpG